VSDHPSIEERLAMARIPWRTFSMDELERIGGAADRIGDVKMLTAVRRVVRAREQAAANASQREL
jgi:hypothetical protein